VAFSVCGAARGRRAHHAGDVGVGLQRHKTCVRPACCHRAVSHHGA
jgi:hypothetical protein